MRLNISSPVYSVGDLLIHRQGRHPALIVEVITTQQLDYGAKRRLKQRYRLIIKNKQTILTRIELNAEYERK